MGERKNWKDIRAERAASIENFVEEVDEARLRMDLAQFVHDLRVAVDITQKELAQRMGTTQSAIARLEGGGTNPSAELLQRLGLALGAELGIVANFVPNKFYRVVLSYRVEVAETAGPGLSAGHVRLSVGTSVGSESEDSSATVQTYRCTLGKRLSGRHLADRIEGSKVFG